jgi:hypothetical protein
MKALRVVLAVVVLSVVGLLSSGCTKTVYEVVQPKADSTKQTVIVITWWESSTAKSDCDIYVNGDIYETIFLGQYLDTIIVPSGATIGARFLLSTYNQQMWVGDTVVSKLGLFTENNGDTLKGQDTLYWGF